MFGVYRISGFALMADWPIFAGAGGTWEQLAIGWWRAVAVKI
jgi:hypothetical protein